MTTGRLRFSSSFVSSALFYAGNKNKSARASSVEFWMRSFYGSESFACHSFSVDANLNKQSGLSSSSSSFWFGVCSSTTTSCVDVESKDRGHVKQCWNAYLGPSFKQQHTRRSGDSRRRKMARIRVAGGGWTVPALDINMYQLREQAVLTNEGPSCIFVGPLETAEKVRLEALYQQARDSYYSGSPLIVDDMFDKVETRLRWHGSKLVLKYPRCSLKRFSAYADAELDASQMLALASVWSVLFASGVVAASFPPVCAINKACQASMHMQFKSHEAILSTDTMIAMNGALAIGMGLVLGIPVAVASARSLQGLWRGDLVALKGFCPSCGEEVYAFVRADQPEQPQHKTECHVCEHPLEFRANVERSVKHPGRLWAYGRVYLSTRSKDLAPSKND